MEPESEHGMTTIKQNVSSKPKVWTAISVPHSISTSSADSLPPYKHYIQITRNILTPDDDCLRHVPWLGDPTGNLEEHEKWFQEMKEGYEEEKDPQASRDGETAARLYQHLNQMLDGMGISYQDLYQPLATSNFQTKKSSKRRKLHNGNNQGTSQNFIQAFSNIFGVELHDVLLQNDPEYRKLLKPRDDQSDNTSVSPDTKGSVSKYLSSYFSLSCLICQQPQCLTHGGSEVDGDYPLFQDYERSIQQRNLELLNYEKNPSSLYKEGESCSGKDCAFGVSAPLKRYIICIRSCG
jgi:hypothetical protein